MIKVKGMFSGNSYTIKDGKIDCGEKEKMQIEYMAKKYVKNRFPIDYMGSYFTLNDPFENDASAFLFLNYIEPIRIVSGENPIKMESKKGVIY